MVLGLTQPLTEMSNEYFLEG